MNKIQYGLLIVLSVAVLIFALLIITPQAEALNNQGAGAAGDNCSIDLPNGLKEPGTLDGKGHCCSVFDSTKCVDAKTVAAPPNLKKTPPNIGQTAGKTQAAPARDLKRAAPNPGQVPEKPLKKAENAESPNAQNIDLRSKTSQMKWKEGANLVYSGGGVKLMAEVKGGKVFRWSASGDTGRSLRTEVSHAAVTCKVCVTVPTSNPSVSHVYCYDIDCSTAPAPKPAQ